MTEMRRDFFTEKEVSLWNSQPHMAVEAELLNNVKQIDKFPDAKD